MELNQIEAKMHEAERKAGLQEELPRTTEGSGYSYSEAFPSPRLGWDELSIEQKIERMRDIVKGINANSHEHWRRLEELGQQMRLHSHWGDGKPLMPLDIRDNRLGMIEGGKVPDGKVYF